MVTAQHSRQELLRLHTDPDGFVWYGDDANLAVNSYLEADDFMQSDLCGVVPASARRVAMLGLPANAGLVVAVQQARAKDPCLMHGQRVSLFSPANFDNVLDPERVLQQLWQPNPQVLLHGNCHDMTNADYVTYAMIRETRAGNHEVARRMLPYHPAWPAVSFVPGVSLDRAVGLLCAIVDPRWYGSDSRPGRFNRLHAWLGLSRPNAAAYLGGLEGGRNYAQAANAFECWYDSRRRSDACVLWRAYGRAADPAAGVVRATRLLAEFVCRVWCDAVGGRHPEVGFRPDLFFKDAAETGRFVRHKASCVPQL
jgi:hypothetical protein